MSTENLNVPIRPPILFILFILFGVILDEIATAWQGGFWGVILGLPFVVSGAYLCKISFEEFMKYKTTFEVKHAQVATLVTTGPFKYSRNPIYVGLSLMYFGIGLLLSNLWILLLYPFVFIMMNVIVIEREERYLASQFGEDYLEYKKLVRRWI